jgi:uncharacterized protein YfbU (UPF0304 family)
MLCDLLLKKKELDAEFIREAISQRQTWALRWQYPGIFDESEPSPPEVNEVVDFLDMWRFIEGAIEKLTPDEIQELESIAGYSPNFSGFDLNNESEYSSIAVFLVDRLNRFQSFAGRAGLNSHSPRIGRYRRMLSVFEAVRPDLAERELNIDDLRAIFGRGML